MQCVRFPAHAPEARAEQRKFASGGRIRGGFGALESPQAIDTGEREGRHRAIRSFMSDPIAKNGLDPRGGTSHAHEGERPWPVDAVWFSSLVREQGAMNRIGVNRKRLEPLGLGKSKTGIRHKQYTSRELALEGVTSLFVATRSRSLIVPIDMAGACLGDTFDSIVEASLTSAWPNGQSI